MITIGKAATKQSNSFQMPELIASTKSVKWAFLKKNRNFVSKY